MPVSLSRDLLIFLKLPFFLLEKLQRALETELQSNEYLSLPMSRVTKKLGYTHSFLYKHLTELCRAISARFERYQAKQCEAKNVCSFVKFARLP